MEARRFNRLRREQELIDKELPVLLLDTINDKDLFTWFISFKGPSQSIYEGEVFCLRFKFLQNYV